MISLKYYKLTITALIVLTLMSFFYSWHITGKNKEASHETTRVLYSRSTDVPSEIIEEIQKSRNFVYVAMYTLTQEDLVNALIAAKLRGLDVKVILDYGQSLIDSEKPQVAKLKKYNIETKIPFRDSGIMHIKLLITDTAYVSGSFNWTNSAATVNDEVVEIGTTTSIHDEFLNIFKKLWEKTN
jgi:phosphatidylserine/phosphatidylglycerophosphate/cardiolipin synthase-like enzyme